jgi:hypothetical protein
MDAHQPLFGKLSRILAVASIMTGLALSSAVSAAILTSNDGFISYDDTLTSVTSFERVGDQINTEFGTAVDAEGVFVDLIAIGLTNLTGTTITLNETITNTGLFPWHEWVEEPFGLPDGLGFPSFVSWSSYDSVAFGSSSARAGTFEEIVVLGIVPALVFNFATPLLPGESFALSKQIAFTGTLNDLDAGVQVLSFGAALPLPPAILLFAAGLSGLGIFGFSRRRIQN